MAGIGLGSKERDRLTNSEYVVAGALSSALTRAACQPLDVLKIRFQLQIEPRKTAKYTSLPQSVGLILREEGIAALWKGHLPAQYLSVVYGAFQFLAFEKIVAGVGRETWYGPSLHFAAGGCAGIAGTLASYPFDVVRTRLVAQCEPKIYSGTMDATRKIYLGEGVKGFFKGIVPTFATIAPYSGLQFAFYSFFADVLKPLVASEDGEVLHMPGSMTCGALAGLCAKTAVFPFDTTKKRLQIQGFDRPKSFGESGQYRGMLDCIRQTVVKEGLRGLFRGLSPGLTKAVATTSINFWLYEYCCQVISTYRQQTK